MTWFNNSARQQGVTLLELLIVVAVSAVLIVGMQGLLSTALNIEGVSRIRNDSVQQGRFAMQLMVNSVKMTQRLMIPLGDNPATTAYLESERDVLAVTLDPTLDRNKDGWADANNDKDYLDVNNNGSRDAGEPERVDEDPAGDITNDNASGIVGIDDNGDGTIDNGFDANDDDEDGVREEDPINGIDDDNDGTIDEDSAVDVESDSAPGIVDFDDNYNGIVDDGLTNDDDDEDGSKDEDWLDPVVYYINGTNLIQRIPNINPTDGTDYQENTVAENVTAFKVTRIPKSGGTRCLVTISLEITPDNGEPVSFLVSVGVGSGL